MCYNSAKCEDNPKGMRMGKLDAGVTAYDKSKTLKSLPYEEWIAELSQLSPSLQADILRFLTNTKIDAAAAWLAFLRDTPEKGDALVEEWKEKFPAKVQGNLAAALLKFEPKPRSAIETALEGVVSTTLGGVGLGTVGVAAGGGLAVAEMARRAAEHTKTLFDGEEVVYGAPFTVAEVLGILKTKLQKNGKPEILSKPLSLNQTSIVIRDVVDGSRTDLLTILITENPMSTTVNVSGTNLDRAAENGLTVAGNLANLAGSLFNAGQGKLLDLGQVIEHVQDVVSEGAEALNDVNLPKKVAEVFILVATAAEQRQEASIQQVLTELRDYRDKAKANATCENCGTAMVTWASNCPICGAGQDEYHNLAQYEQKYGLHGSIPFGQLDDVKKARTLALQYIYPVSGKPRLI